MRSPGVRFVLFAWLQAILLTTLTASCLADGGPSPNMSRLLLRTDPLSVSSPDVTRLAVRAPGQPVSQVLAVFKLRFDDLLPGLFGIERETLRPYLLGGQTSLRMPNGRAIGQYLPGSIETHALHIGAGAEVRLRDRLFLSVAFGEVLHSGPLSALSYQTYKLGMLLDF